MANSCSRTIILATYTTFRAPLSDCLFYFATLFNLLTELLSISQLCPVRPSSQGRDGCLFGTREIPNKEFLKFNIT